MGTLREATRLGALLLGLWPDAARADAVFPPPDTCPPGSVPSTSHAGPHCRPAAECVLSSMCGAGEACEAVGLCIEDVPCGGRLPPGDAGVCTEPHVVGTCSPSGACSVGSCELRNVCVQPSSARSGCACRAGRADAGLADAGLGSAGVLLWVAALAARRR